MPTTKDVQIEIQAICIEIAKMLCDKNERYGNSAIEPKRIFSSSSPIEQINVRIDDKLSRIKHATETGIEDNEDAELDLIGYLILKRAARNLAMKETKSGVVEYPNAEKLKAFFNRRLHASYEVTTEWLEEQARREYVLPWTTPEIFYCMKEIGWGQVARGFWVRQGSK